MTDKRPPQAEFTESERRKMHLYLHQEYLGDKRRSLFREHPIITDGAKDFLEEFVRECGQVRVLEFGGGGSTIWFARNAARLITVEHDEFWFGHLRERLREMRLEQNVQLMHCSRPYHHVADQLQDGSVDLVLVDGRDRVRCALASTRVLRSGGVMMLDNSERAHYSRVHDELKKWKQSFAAQEQIVDRYGFVADDIAWTTHWWIKP